MFGRHRVGRLLLEDGIPLAADLLLDVDDGVNLPARRTSVPDLFRMHRIEHRPAGHANVRPVVLEPRHDGRRRIFGRVEDARRDLDDNGSRLVRRASGPWTATTAHAIFVSIVAAARRRPLLLAHMRAPVTLITSAGNI